MRLLPVLLAGAALTGGTSAYAADALKFGAPPSWVVPQPVPTNVKATDAPIAVLLTDEQIALDPGKVTTYRDGVLKIQTPQGLAAGSNTVGDAADFEPLLLQIILRQARDLGVVLDEQHLEPGVVHGPL